MAGIGERVQHAGREPLAALEVYNMRFLIIESIGEQ